MSKRILRLIREKDLPNVIYPNSKISGSNEPNEVLHS